MERENHPKTVIRLELQRIAPRWQTKAPGLLLVAAAFLVALWGLKDIPFHPDEASYLYMSSDLELLLNQPFSLAFDPANSTDPRQEMRARDAPLTRYLLGLGRAALHQPALSSDWDWSQTWDVNRLAGALPNSRLLFAGRLAAALLLPFSVLFLNLTGKRIGGTLCGFTAGLLLLTNALVLLHARRAMGEAGLLFTVCLAAYCFTRADRYAWLAGLAAALAFSAKQSGLALFPAGLLAAGWIPAPSSSRLRAAAFHLGQYLGVFLIACYLLNPFWWRLPLAALQASWRARQELLQRQVAEIGAQAPEQVLSSPAQRSFILLANLYLTPPAFEEAANYRAETAASEAAYLESFGHNLLRSLPGAGLLLFFSLAGFGLALAGFRHTEVTRRRELAVLILGTVFMAAGLLLAVPLPWQRYVLPLVPFSCLWAGYAVSVIAELVKNRTSYPAQEYTPE
jgi:hypothetical protein